MTFSAKYTLARTTIVTVKYSLFVLQISVLIETEVFVTAAWTNARFQKLLPIALAYTLQHFHNRVEQCRWTQILFKKPWDDFALSGTPLFLPIDIYNKWWDILPAFTHKGLALQFQVSPKDWRHKMWALSCKDEPLRKIIHDKQIHGREIMQ